MNTIWRSFYIPSVLGTSLLLLSSAPLVAQEGAEVLRKEALSDPSPGAFSQSQGATWTLLSTEEGGKLVGRVTWSDPAHRSIFEVEAAATLQKGAEEVELLNLDGLAGGDSSVKGKWSWSGSWLRGGKTLAEGGGFLPLCKDLSAALEHQLASGRRSACSDSDHCMTPECCSAANHEFELIALESCTLEELEEIGGEWPSAAQKAVRDALQAGCDELAKLHPKLKFQPAGFELIPGPRPALGVRLCTEAGLKDAVDEIREARLASIREIDQELGELAAEERKLIAELARLDADFAATSSRPELETIAAERYMKRSALESLQAKAAEKKAEKKPPAILADFDGWLKKTRGEKLAAVCKSYNQPNRSHHFPLLGEDAHCNTVKIPESIAAIESRPLRSAYFKRFIREIPVAVWYLTFSAGASNRDFKFVEAASLTEVETFAEVDKLVVKEAEIDTSIGVTWSSQIGNHFLSVGYERRNKHSGGVSTEVCAPIESGGTVTRCLGTTAGAPTRIDQNLGLVEWRTYVTGSVGLKLRTFYIDDDFRRGTPIENEWEVHALLYFLPHKEKGLNGGLDVGYDTAFEDLAARVFIGQSFDIFK